MLFSIPSGQAAAPITVDGSITKNCIVPSGTTCVVSGFSNGGPNDLIYVVIWNETGTKINSVSDTAGLSYSLRATISTSPEGSAPSPGSCPPSVGCTDGIVIYTALAAAKLTSDTITIVQTLNTGMAVKVFSFANTNFANPFNGFTPAKTWDSTTSSVQTPNATVLVPITDDNPAVIGMMTVTTVSTYAAASGYTNIFPSAAGPGPFAEYRTGLLGPQTVTFTQTGQNDAWDLVADVVNGIATPIPLPSQSISTAVVVMIILVGSAAFASVFYNIQAGADFRKIMASLVVGVVIVILIFVGVSVILPIIPTLP